MRPGHVGRSLEGEVMTMTVNLKVDAPAGVELEIIEAWAGVEQRRFRQKDTDIDAAVTVYGSKTLILREVAAEAPHEVKTGEQRHGDLTAAQAVAAVDAALTAAGAVPAGFEDGDTDPESLEYIEQMYDAQERVLVLVGQFLQTEGTAIQMQLYEEMAQAYKAYSDAVAVAHAHDTRTGVA